MSVTYLFSPPTFEEVVWADGVDTRWRGGIRVGISADPVWRHFGAGARGHTVIRSGGTYRTVNGPTSTDFATADTIRFPDGTLGPAVFLGGHLTPVTSTIKAELEAAGFTVETSGDSSYPALTKYPSVSLYPGTG